MTQTNTNIFDDNSTEQLAYSLQPQKYKEIKENRLARRRAAYDLYINLEYPTYPLPDLDTYIRVKNKLISVNADRDTLEITQRIQEIQTKIDNQDYCVEGTPAWTTRQEFLAYAANFQWPDANELTTRELEKQELLSLINS
jgi:hypothetical protein